MTDKRIDIIAHAIKAATDEFESPVNSYIEPEAKKRWERENPDGDWYELPSSSDDLESYRIIARAVVAALGQGALK